MRSLDFWQNEHQGALMNIGLIVGCARSGTSILGELGSLHPDVKYIFEAHQIWELGGLGVNGSHQLTAAHATSESKALIREWFVNQKGAAKLLLEKNPRNVLRIPYVRGIFPKAKIVHIVRDGRDVACSMVPGCGGDHWSHLKPPLWKNLFLSYQGALRCALAWKEIMEIALQDLAEVPHLQIRYEDLIADPYRVLQQLLSYLNLDPDPAVTNFCKKIQNSTTDSYHARIQTMWYRDDHRMRVGRWRENLTEEDSDIINSALSPLLCKLGYT